MEQVNNKPIEQIWETDYYKSCETCKYYSPILLVHPCTLFSKCEFGDKWEQKEVKE